MARAVGITCPMCWKSEAIPADLIGEDVVCPDCGNWFRCVPDSERGAPPPPRQLDRDELVAFAVTALKAGKARGTIRKGLRKRGAAADEVTEILDEAAARVASAHRWLGLLQMGLSVLIGVLGVVLALVGIAFMARIGVYVIPIGLVIVVVAFIKGLIQFISGRKIR